MLKIVSWNVNGIRACLKKDFIGFIESFQPDILGIQETKAKLEQIDEEDRKRIESLGYQIEWNPADKAGYSGTALFINRKTVQSFNPSYYSFGVKRFDEPNEGRVIITEFQHQSRAFTLFNIYFPNGQMNEDRLSYKLDFYDEFLEFIVRLKEDANPAFQNQIIMGDFNTAHQEIDLKNPKENAERSGFLPIEREWMDRLEASGYVDTYREFFPKEEKYSWWTYRFGARERNIGWRIDYVYVNREMLSSVKEAYILNDVTGSDHCPVGIVLD